MKDPYRQQKELTKNVEAPMIFDVGAYRGDMVQIYDELFPNAVIHAFEPSASSFEILETVVDNKKNIIPHRLAFGDEEGTALLNINKYLPTNSLLASHENASYYWGKNLLDTNLQEAISVSTIDMFCTKEAITKIDILKLDTQGSEYYVLEGALTMLSKQKIGLIYMEIILVDTYIGQRALPEITDFLAKFGYRLFNIYNPMISIGKELNQIDAIFVPCRTN